MSDQPKDQNQKKRVVRSRVAAPVAPRMTAAPPAAALPDEPEAPMALEPAASAALGLAVGAAKKDPPPAETIEAAKPAPIMTPETGPSRVAALMRRPAAQAAAVLVALGAGWLGAQAFTTTRSDAQASGAQWAETAQSLRQGQQDVVRLTGDIRALKVAMDALKESVDRSKADLMAKQSQVVERIERTDRAPADHAARLGKLAEQLDRVEAVAKDPGVKLAALNERFDRIERQITTLQTAAAKPAAAAPVPAPIPAPAPAASPEAPAQTGSLEAKPAAPAAKEPPKDVPVEGWVLHEVYDGVALIEGRNRRLFEVGPGGVIPGVGAVESIERRGKRWVVLTSKGYIGMER